MEELIVNLGSTPDPVEISPTKQNSLLDVPRVSFTQINSLNKCEFAWNLGFNELWTPKEPKTFFEVGNDVHKYFQMYYKNIGMTSTKHCLEMIDVEIEKRVRKATQLQDVDKMKRVVRAAQITKTYITKYAPEADKDWEVLDTEKFFDVALESPMGRRYILQVGIDLLFRSKESKRISIVDHKSMEGLGKFWSPMQVLMDPQMPTYIVALRKIGVGVFSGIINMANTYMYKDPNQPLENLFRREPAYFTNTELDGHLLELGHAVDRMLDIKERGVYRRSRSHSCNYCFFAEPCLMSLKGLPIQDTLETSFRRKMSRDT